MIISPGLHRRDASSENSRRQLVVLRSMDRQDRPRGATTLVVDADRTGDLHRNDLINFAVDHDLTFPLLVGDGAGAIMTSYGVPGAPVLVIIDARGRTAARWEGVAPAQSVAAVLETLCRP